MQISPSFGYDAIVPLLRHRRILIPQTAAPDFCRHPNALAVSIPEFTPAARDYPLVFAAPDDGKPGAERVVCVAGAARKAGCASRRKAGAAG